MGQRTISRSLVTMAVFFTAGLGISACGGGGGSSGGPADTDLYLQKFLVVDRSDNPKSLGGTGSTDVYRDARLQLTFNVPVDMSTVNDRTVRVGIPAGGGLFLTAVGRFSQNPDSPNEVFFDPTFTKSNPGSTADNPLGFEANAIYQVELLSVYDSVVNVRNLSGGGLVATYRAQFQTIDQYLPSNTQPEISGHDPADGATGIPARSDIRIFFTEPMKPSTFVLGQTFIVLDESSGRIPIGEIRFSSDYKIVTFRPLFGYGKGVDNPDPDLAGVPISVSISRGVTNLAGRQIPVSLQFSFRTEYDPTQPNFDDRREEFTNTTFEDRTYGNPPLGDLYPLASWNGVTPGALRGIFTSGTATVVRSSYSTVTLEPWACGAVAMQFQSMYFPSEVGGSSRTIKGFEWYKYCTSFTTTVNSCKILLGHTKSGALTTNFAGNYSDTPVTCVGGVTYVINTGSRVWQAGPAFTTDFPYNGSDNLILEIQHTTSSGGGYLNNPAGNRGHAEWMEYNGGTAFRAVYTPAQAATYGTTARVWEYGTRFTYLIEMSEAQSKWYDMGFAQPQFLDAVVLATVPVGSVLDITFQGAPELPLSAGLPDLGNATGWMSALSDVSGYRFVRFHAEIKGNGQTNQLPEVDTILFPFIFFD